MLRYKCYLKKSIKYYCQLRQCLLLHWYMVTWFHVFFPFPPSLSRSSDGPVPPGHGGDAESRGPRRHGRNRAEHAAVRGQLEGQPRLRLRQGRPGGGAGRGGGNALRQDQGRKEGRKYTNTRTSSFVLRTLYIVEETGFKSVYSTSLKHFFNPIPHFLLRLFITPNLMAFKFNVIHDL